MFKNVKNDPILSVANLEKLLEDKIESEVKEYMDEIEKDPLSHLVPPKQNVDLKRHLDTKIASIDIDT